MKNKMIIKIILAVLIIIILFFGGWYIMFSFFGIGPVFPFLSTQEINSMTINNRMLAEEQLMTFAKTEEEAQEIAKQYNIELVSFSDGVAAYRTEEDPYDVIAKGQENGYPAIYLNYKRDVD